MEHYMGAWKLCMGGLAECPFGSYNSLVSAIDVVTRCDRHVVLYFRPPWSMATEWVRLSPALWWLGA